VSLSSMFGRPASTPAGLSGGLPPVSIDVFVDAYTAACEAEKQRPRAYVLNACDGLAGVHSGAELHCNGNAVGLRSKRLLDDDVIMLTRGLAAGHPFALLNLSYNHLGVGAAEVLAGWLSTDSTLEVLDLSHNDMDENAAAMICSALCGNTTLRALSLSGNNLRGPGGMSISQMLQSNSSLRRLELDNCSLDTPNLVAIATVLRQNASLEVLGLSRPLIQGLNDCGTDHLSRTLAVNRTLVDLDLSKAGMRDEGLMLLAAGLLRAGESATLRALRLGCNKLRLADRGCLEMIGELLASPSCPLETLDLGHNGFGNEGALVLSELLTSNGSLRKVDVCSNGITSRGLCALGPAAAHHRSMQEVSVWGNQFDSAACSAWLPATTALVLDIAVGEVDGVYHCVRL